MNTQNKYKTITIPLFNSLNHINSFKILNNIFIAELQVKDNTTINNGVALIDKTTRTLRYEFILPKDHSHNIEFESDVTITYEIINSKLHLVNIDALYAEDYIENIESNYNIFPIYNNGSINFSSDNDNTTFNTAC